jgi:hypothetical protein
MLDGSHATARFSTTHTQGPKRNTTQGRAGNARGNLTGTKENNSANDAPQYRTKVQTYTVSTTHATRRPSDRTRRGRAARCRRAADASARMRCPAGNHHSPHTSSCTEPRTRCHARIRQHGTADEDTGTWNSRQGTGRVRPTSEHGADATHNTTHTETQTGATRPAQSADARLAHTMKGQGRHDKARADRKQLA